MAITESWFKQDLKNRVIQQYIVGNFFSLDNMGNLVGVKVYDNGAEAILSGSVTGYCALADGTTVPVSGTRSGNQAYILLPQSVLSITGPIGIVLKLTDGNTITTLLSIIATVYPSQTDDVITPSQQVITDWAQQINAALQNVVDASAAQDVKISDLKDAFININDGVLERYQWPMKIQHGRFLSNGFNDTIQNYARSTMIIKAGTYRFAIPTGFSYLPVIYNNDSSGTPVLSTFSYSNQTLVIDGDFYMNFMKTDTGSPNFTAEELAALESGFGIIRISQKDNIEEKVNLMLLGDGNENKFNGHFVVGEQVATSSGDFVDGSEFARTTYIPVKMGKVYIGNNALTTPATIFIHCALYNSDKQKVRAFPYTGISVTKSGDLYYQEIDVSVDGYIAFDIYAFNIGNSGYYLSQTKPQGYVDYQQSTYRINPALLDSTANSEIVASMTYGKSPSRKFQALMGNNNVITLETNSITVNQCITFFAIIDSFTTESSIYVGHGQGAYGYYVIIDHEKIVCGSNGTTGTSKTHGINIADYIYVQFEVNYAGTMKVVLASRSGVHSETFSIGATTKGEVFAKSVSCNLLKCVLTWDCNDYGKRVWAFGDSYFSYYSNKRWPYYILRNYSGNRCPILLNGYPGEASENALLDLKAALNHGTPKYLLWCLGMNDHDTDSAVNTVWLQTVTEVENICDEKGITLILCTIPDVTNAAYNNTYKNQWILESGYRYVDLADVVTGVNGWLDADGVHPSEIGARLLASKVVADFPEILQYDK